MNYCPLLTIQLLHAYYISGKSADFRLVPSAETIRLMEGHRLMWREKKSAWQITTSLNDDGAPFLPMDEATILRFYLSATTPGIIHVTDWDQAAGVPLDFGKVLAGHLFLHFTYDGTSSLKGGVYRHFETEVLKVKSPGLEEAFFLQGSLLPGILISDLTIGGEQVAIQFDPDQKKLTLDTTRYQPGAELLVRYPAIPAWARGVIGVVDIPLDSPNAIRQVFDLSFSVRRVKWKYYVAARETFDTFSMADMPDSLQDGSTGTIEFIPQDIRLLEESDLMADWMKRKFSSMANLVRFTSKEEVAFSEKTQKNICLMGNGRALLAHLPVPSLERPDKQIVTYIS
ncbi:MAG: hypothetical protein JNL02_09565 [Saprospiraceae bacterium]|nr:hypothetical protein [Saprospiraceae bacterium]